MRISILVSICVLGALLSACQSTTQNDSNNKKNEPLSRPKEKIKVYIPPENNNLWQNIGVSPNGNILNELEKKSVVRSGDIVSFRDKKTIFDKSKETSLISLPDFKYSINSWQINCRLNTFQLKSIELYDANNNLIESHKYTNQQVKPMLIPAKSASEQQKKFVCDTSRN